MIRQIRISEIVVIILLCCLLQARKLVMIHQIFRHGARYAYSPMKNDFTDYVLEQKVRGQLTLQGRHMQYVLGKIMYDKYWNLLFANTEYAQKYHPSQIYVKSTNFNRTIESADAHLLGLLQKLPVYELPASQIPNSLPPFQNALSYQDSKSNSKTFQVYGKMNAYFHLAPIHQVAELQARSGANYKYRANPYDEGDFLAKYDQQNCPNQLLWTRENLVSEKAMKIKNSPQVKNYLEKLSAIVASKVKYEDALHYWDDFISAKFLSKKRLQAFEDPELYKVADFVSLSYQIIYYFHTQTQIKAVNTRLLQAIINNMKQAIIQKGPRMVLYSAHDTTLLSFATALNFTNIHCLMQYFYEGKKNDDTCINQYPPFASNFVIELWEEDNFSHTIKILYNGIQRKIPICGYKNSCGFSEFQKWVEDFYIDDPNDVCGIREQYLKLYIVIAVLCVFLVIFIIVQMRVSLKKKMQKKMQEIQERKGYLEHIQEKDIQFHSHKHDIQT